MLQECGIDDGASARQSAPSRSLRRFSRRPCAVIVTTGTDRKCVEQLVRVDHAIHARRKIRAHRRKALDMRPESRRRASRAAALRSTSVSRKCARTPG